MPPLVTMQSVSKVFGETEALHEISWGMEAGEAMPPRVSVAVTVRVSLARPLSLSERLARAALTWP